MLVAKQKRKENIIEYILYIRQIQDIIRASKFDIEIIDKTIINGFEVNENVKSDMRQWYSDIILDLKSEKKEEVGDIRRLEILIDEINKLHIDLLNDSQEYKHAELYRWAKPNIEEYRKLSKQENANDVKVCLDALYNLLLLRLIGKDFSEDTMQAMQTFSNLMAHLALHFRTRGM